MAQRNVLEVVVDTRAWAKEEAWFRKEFLPDAMALGLNWAAQDARDSERRRLDRHFTGAVRPAFAKNVISGPPQKDFKASPLENPSPVAVVGVKSDRFEFMPHHETSKDREPQVGERERAIPSQFIKNKRSKQGRIPAKWKMKALLRGTKSPRAVILTAPDGRRFVKGNRPETLGTSGRQLILYWLKPQFHIPRGWNFLEMTARAFALKYPRALQRAWKQTTSRKPRRIGTTLGGKKILFAGGLKTLVGK